MQDNKEKNRKKHERRKKNGHYVTLSWKYRIYKKDSKSRGYDFTLTKDDFKQLSNRPCRYCGVMVAIGVDRLDNANGYIKGNVDTCCRTCNVAKGIMSEVEYINHCKQVAELN